MSARTQRQKRAQREAAFEEATKCPHCGLERSCAPLGAWQDLNRELPIPGVYGQLSAMEAAYGANILVLACIECFCFQPVGFIPRHAH